MHTNIKHKTPCTYICKKKTAKETLHLFLLGFDSCNDTTQYDQTDLKKRKLNTDHLGGEKQPKKIISPTLQHDTLLTRIAAVS